MKLKWGDVQTGVSCNWSAMMWKNRQHVNILTNMHFYEQGLIFLWTSQKVGYFETLIDGWGKWTNLTACQTLVHCYMALEMDKEAIFPASGIYHSQHCHHSHFLWFRIITLTLMKNLIIQYVGRVPETQTTRQERQVPSISQLNILDTRCNKQWPLERNWVPCVFHYIQSNKNEIQVPRRRHGVVCYPVFWCISHQTTFLRTIGHGAGKVEHTDMSKYCHGYYWTDISE
jgi:hypothetical protein